MRKIDQLKRDLYRELEKQYVNGNLPEVQDVLVMDSLVCDPAITNPVENSLKMLLKGVRQYKLN